MITTKLICNNCGVEFEKPTKEITRQIKKGRKEFYCSLSCSTKKLKTTTEKKMVKCLWCENEFETTTHKKAKKCCCQSCSHKYSQSKVNSEMHSLSLKRGKLYPILKKFKCVVCNKMFKKTIKSKSIVFQTCGIKCYRSLLSKKSIENPNCGGETGYKHYQYKNIWMDSKWEIEIAKLLDCKNIKWERDRKKHMFWWTDKSGIKRRYYPDFYLPDYKLYLDPKNKYKAQLDLEKITNVIKENGIKLLWGDLNEIKKDVDSLVV